VKKVRPLASSINFNKMVANFGSCLNVATATAIFYFNKLNKGDTQWQRKERTRKRRNS